MPLIAIWSICGHCMLFETCFCVWRLWRCRSPEKLISRDQDLPSRSWPWENLRMCQNTALQSAKTRTWPELWVNSSEIPNFYHMNRREEQGCHGFDPQPYHFPAIPWHFPSLSHVIYISFCALYRWDSDDPQSDQWPTYLFQAKDESHDITHSSNVGVLEGMDHFFLSILLHIYPLVMTI